MSWEAEDEDFEDKVSNPQAERNKSTREMKNEAFRDKAAARARKSSGLLIVMLGFAVLVLADALVIENNDENSNTGQAVGISITSMMVCIGKYIHFQFFHKKMSAPIEILIALFLLLLWGSAVIVTTFRDGGTFQAETSTGFFATWICLLISGSYLFSMWSIMSRSADETYRKTDNDDEPKSGLLAYKKGVTSLSAGGIILVVGVIASAAISLQTDLPRGGRAIFAIVCAIPSLIILLATVFVPLKAYGPLNNYFISIFILVILQTTIIFFAGLSEPFQIRVLNDGEIDFIVNGNGLFSTIGAFIVSVAILWRSHIILLIYNDDNDDITGMKGRHIWLFLIWVSSIVILVESALSCQQLDGCSNNFFVVPALWMSFFSAFICVLSYFLCRKNVDLGDQLYIQPETIIVYLQTTAEKMEFAFAAILLLIWTAGALLLTFALGSPFSDASSGFFFTWFALIFSAYYFNDVFPKIGFLSCRCMQWEIPNKMSPKANVGFTIIAFGVLAQAASVGALCIEEKECLRDDFVAFVFHGIIFSLVFFLVLTKPQTLGYCAIFLCYMLILLSYINLLVTTVVSGPFIDNQGNGFFAAWVIVYGASQALSNYEWSLHEL